jgi:acyl carrier protein
MTTHDIHSTALSPEAIEAWLAAKVASRLGVDPATIDVDQFFDEFGLDSTEALVLAGELEAWIGMELKTTALWYHPTIAELAAYIAEELASGASSV